MQQAVCQRRPASASCCLKYSYVFTTLLIDDRQARRDIQVSCDILGISGEIEKEPSGDLPLLLSNIPSYLRRVSCSVAKEDESVLVCLKLTPTPQVGCYLIASLMEAPIFYLPGAFSSQQLCIFNGSGLWSTIHVPECSWSDYC